MKRDYTVGESLFILTQGKPSKHTKVTAVRQYKLGTKVTCEDGSVWDPDRCRLWGCRSDSWYQGPYLAPHTEELVTAYAAVVAKRRMTWALANFEKLTPTAQIVLSNLILGYQKEQT